jgi:hypothetical protein
VGYQRELDARGHLTFIKQRDAAIQRVWDLDDVSDLIKEHATVAIERTWWLGGHIFSYAGNSMAVTKTIQEGRWGPQLTPRDGTLLYALSQAFPGCEWRNTIVADSSVMYTLYLAQKTFAERAGETAFQPSDIVNLIAWLTFWACQSHYTDGGGNVQQPGLAHRGKNKHPLVSLLLDLAFKLGSKEGNEGLSEQELWQLTKAAPVCELLAGTFYVAEAALYLAQGAAGTVGELPSAYARSGGAQGLRAGSAGAACWGSSGSWPAPPAPQPPHPAARACWSPRPGQRQASCSQPSAVQCSWQAGRGAAAAAGSRGQEAAG